MPRKLLAIFLVFTWIYLSGFDLLEDLQLPLNDAASAHSSKAHSHDGNRPTSLANNMVESAIKAPATYKLLVRPDDSLSTIHSFSSLQRALDLHKLHRVFLI